MNEISSPRNGISAESRRYLPWLVAVALFMENLDTTIVNTAVPTMAAGLHVLPLSLKAVLTSYTISLAVFIPISGWMADRYGTKRIFALAITLFMLGSLFCGLALNVPMLVASRILQGVGGAMMTPVGRLALVRAFPRSEMITAMNYVVIPALIGPLLGPFVGGLIVHWLDWRVIFFINLPFALAGLALLRRHMPDFREDDVPPLDREGFLLFGSGIALLSYVLEIFGEHTLGTGEILFLLACACVLLFAYGWHSRETKSPVLALELFRIRTFRLSVLGGLFTRLGIGGMPFVLALLYQIGLGYLPWQAGLLMMPQAAAAICMKLMTKLVLARFGHRRVLIVNTALLGMTIMIFTHVGPGTPIWAILLLSFGQGFFSSLQFTSMNTLVYADISNHDASKASSIASTAQQMALSFGVAFSSLLAAWFLGHVDRTDPAQLVPALHHAFFVIGCMTVVSSLIFSGLHANDGNNVSNRSNPETEAAAKAG
ncbi:MAG TPA: MFS transporter [Opitutaceae bacterium]|jgi:EmrB/QacA subfamily drug resistance transporter|nr:MFS transporter [Opitutaceae bacterium]